MSIVIRRVLESFGGKGEGFAGADWATDHMFEFYQRNKGKYYVIAKGDEVLGGGGLAQLEHADSSWCGRQKMSFLEEIRGLGFGKELIERAMMDAIEMGFEFMYLETLSNMNTAQALYERYGFSRLEGPVGNTGHFGCNVWMSRPLIPKP